jgi:hypothetical protein
LVCFKCCVRLNKLIVDKIYQNRTVVAKGPRPAYG